MNSFFFLNLFLNFLLSLCLSLLSLGNCMPFIHFHLNLLKNSLLQLQLSLFNRLNLSLHLLNWISFDTLFNPPDFVNILCEPRLDLALVVLESLDLLLVLLLNFISELISNFQVLGFQCVNLVLCVKLYSFQKF